MKECIERAELYEAMNSQDCEFSLIDALALIEEFPAADVVEVKHGRWYLAEDAVFRCSECGRICYELDAPYCYCGTRMDKEDEHEAM